MQLRADKKPRGYQLGEKTICWSDDRRAETHSICKKVGGVSGFKSTTSESDICLFPDWNAAAETKEAAPSRFVNSSPSRLQTMNIHA
jgi:hypothetical protein